MHAQHGLPKLKSMKYTHIILVALALLMIPFTGCLKDRKELVGTWTIDEIKINGYDVKEKMSANVFTFKFEGTVLLPLMEYLGTSNGTWLVKRDDEHMYLDIISDNNVLATHYNLKYLDGDKQQRNVNKIRFYTDNIDVYCTRVSRD